MGARKSNTVWITRASPGAETTADRVRAMGHAPLVAPLLQVRPVADARIDLRGVAALAFTSANGVRAFAEQSAERGLKVFAVGAATGSAAKTAGFRTVLTADGDVAALADRIAQRRRELNGAVLHPGAAEPAGDLVGDLTRAGLEARGVALYETVFIDPPQDQLDALLAADVVLLHSPKGAKALARILKGRPAPKMRALGLSRAVMKPLARSGLADRGHPPMPLEAALLNLIDRTA